MRKIASTFVLLVIMVSCSSDNEVDELMMKSEFQKTDNKDKVIVCHKGKKNLSIDITSLKDHLDHGDLVGPCGALDYTFVPDDNFEQALIDLKYDDILDNLVLTENISTLSRLDVKNRNINDLTGIEDFISLKILNVTGNHLVSLNFESNINLIDIYCGSNALESLNVVNNSALEFLRCERNLLMELELSNNTSLITLQCFSNKLSSLNLKNVNLNTLNALNNPLLECIEVTNVEYYELNFLNRIPSGSSFADDCSVNFQ